jgi:hypothetical protein
VNSSAHITWGELDITYPLADEGERWICQQRSHARENQTSLTLWKMKGKGEFISTDHMKKSKSLTSWKVKGIGEFISTDHMERIRNHLRTGS